MVSALVSDGKRLSGARGALSVELEPGLPVLALVGLALGVFEGQFKRAREAGLSWSPDGTTIASAASPMGGFNAQFHTRIYAVHAAGGEPRAVVDRPGMNTSPQYSPDGRWIGFISTDGVAEMVSTWGLHVAPAAGGAGIRNLSKETGNWVGDFGRHSTPGGPSA